MNFLKVNYKHSNIDLKEMDIVSINNLKFVYSSLYFLMLLQLKKLRLYFLDFLFVLSKKYFEQLSGFTNFIVLL